jgi:glycosyltransferase involved in cell wall biosynthesis
LPHIAPSTPPPQRQDLWGIPPGDFVFYTINAWTERKALWLTIRSFLNAFRSHDPVTLVVKTSQEDFTRPWLLGRRFSSTRLAVRRILREYRDPAAVVLIDRVVPESEILALHARVDCFLSLSRCEGWGLGAFDAAAYGTPVIITDYGGQLDYLQPGALGLVRGTLIPVHDTVGYPSYAPDQRWAEPSLQHACALMRALVADPRRARTSAAAIRERIHEQFNERRVTADLLRALEDQP